MIFTNKKTNLFSRLKPHLLLCVALLFVPVFSSVCAEVYTDSNAYFSIEVPGDWKQDDFSFGYKSELMFRSPDGKAVCVVIAELNSQNILDLWLVKKEFIAEHQKRFPGGKFSLSKSSIAGFEALKIEYAIPPVTRQEFYIFFFDGVRFDLIYSATSNEAFGQYHEAVMDIFSMLKPQKRALFSPK